MSSSLDLTQIVSLYMRPSCVSMYFVIYVGGPYICASTELTLNFVSRKASYFSESNPNVGWKI